MKRQTINAFLSVIVITDVFLSLLLAVVLSLDIQMETFSKCFFLVFDAIMFVIFWYLIALKPEEEKRKHENGNGMIRAVPDDEDE
jgi:Kef-type K+ transport system membrane component KefB